MAAKSDKPKETFTFKNSEGRKITTHNRGTAAEMRQDSRFTEVKSDKSASAGPSTGAGSTAS